MKRNIFKYQIPKGFDEQIILIPTGAKILSCELVKDIICVYALVDPDNGFEERQFKVYLTGEGIDFNDCLERKFIGTCQDNDFVYHVFELR